LGKRKRVESLKVEGRKPVKRKRRRGFFIVAGTSCPRPSLEHPAPSSDPGRAMRPRSAVSFKNIHRQAAKAAKARGEEELLVNRDMMKKRLLQIFPTSIFDVGCSVF
jgi:hypothetical protein